MSDYWNKVPPDDRTINLRGLDLDPELLQLIPRELALRHMFMPVDRKGATLVLAVEFPCNLDAVAEIEFHTGYKVELVHADREEIKEAIEKNYGQN